MELDAETAVDFSTIGADYAIPIPYRDAKLTGISAEIRGSGNWRGVMLGADIRPHIAGIEDQFLKAALYAGFAGLILGLLVYNLAVWWAQRYRFQLYYCGMVAALLGYAAISSGVIYDFWPGLENNGRLRLDYVALALAAAFTLQFFSHFFGPEVIGPRLRKIIAGVIAALFVSTAALVVFAPWGGTILYRLFVLSLLAMLTLIPAVSVIAWRAGSRNIGLFVTAWSAPFLVSVARIFASIGMLPYNFWLENGNLIALSIEALLSTLLIVARLRELSIERDRAKASEQSALRLANADPLTGLLNRRAFVHLAIGRPATHRLLLVDIDHFKAINDRLGHDAGDDVLCAVAEVLQACRPPDSLAVRLGGEEFALLLPLQRQRECLPERILEAIRAKAMPLNWKVTVSLGFADGKVSTEEDWKRLYRLADAALYRAKADGRDRACRATDFAVAGAA
jgi:diguanylate cyclase (GGDEF)-like protein